METKREKKQLIIAQNWTFVVLFPFFPKKIYFYLWCFYMDIDWLMTVANIFFASCVSQPNFNYLLCSLLSPSLCRWSPLKKKLSKKENKPKYFCFVTLQRDFQSVINYRSSQMAIVVRYHIVDQVICHPLTHRHAINHLFKLI